jgi:deazaflavin-dependent oxidoreductase (nitroreductase family)
LDFPKEIIEAASRVRQVRLTTRGRKTGRPVKVTIWISTDGRSIFVRSGGGLRRHWPQNLMAAGDAVLEVGGHSIKVRPRHVTEPSEARAASQLVRKKYGSYVRTSTGAEPLTLGEQATFELLPAD